MSRPYFHAGQRVICVDAAPNPLESGPGPLVAGRIYVVRAIDVGFTGRPPGWGVHLHGVQLRYPDAEDVPWPFHPRRFRPVTQRPTDIAVFEKMLTTEVLQEEHYES